MDHFIRIYTSQAVEYQKLIAAEDADHHLLAAFTGILDLHGKTIVDLGTGTGRIPVLLCSQGGRMVGLDLHLNMLKENRRLRDEAGSAWAIACADMRTCPLPPG